MSGTVNIARALMNHEAFKDQPFTEREAFIWLIMEASWKPRTKRVGNVIVELDRGQVAVSVRFMAEAWQWKKSTVFDFLERLKKSDMIRTDTRTGVSVVTVCNYDTYQGEAEKSGQGKRKNPDSIRTASGQTRTPEVIPDAIHKENSSAHSDFAAFWNAYPHRDGKRGRAVAEAKFAAAVKRGIPPQTIIDGAKRAHSDPRVKAGYARDPTTWLNQAGWDDEIAQTVTPIRGGYTPEQQQARDAAFAAMVAKARQQ